MNWLPVRQSVVLAVGLGADEAVGRVVEAAARAQALVQRRKVVAVAAATSVQEPLAPAVVLVEAEPDEVHIGSFKYLLLLRVSRVVGGWAKMAKKCLTPSKIQNSKKWSKVCSRVLWNRVTMAGS